MNFIQSQSRNQIEFFCLEDRIEKANPVRFLEAFVEHIELKKLNFKVSTIKSEGRPGSPTNTIGINANYLWPTLIFKKGDYVRLNVQNLLTDTTTVHWHGLHLAKKK